MGLQADYDLEEADLSARKEIEKIEIVAA